MFRFTVALVLVLLASCTDVQIQRIHAILEERNQSISQQDIQKYTSLLDEHYFNHEGQHKVAQMAKIFTRFEKVQMTSRDQDIRIIDDHHAICEQTYILKVFADGGWREIVQREQLTFTNTNGIWKISGGL